MPRIKKVTVTDKAEIQPLIPQEGQSSLMTPVSTDDNKGTVENKKSAKTVTTDISSDIQVPTAKMPKKEFKQIHIKDIFWLENDIFQTIADMTEGKKGAKALIINEALKDYLHKKDIEIKPLRIKAKKYK